MAARFRNEKYYRKLSKKERRQFRLDCEKHKHGHFKRFMVSSELIENIHDFLSCAFEWERSLQGSAYWLKIARRFHTK